MPRWSKTQQFVRDLKKLDRAQVERFKRVLHEEFVPDLRVGKFRPGLRVKGVVAARGVFEMTWAPNGRATFQYGDEIVRGDPYIVWRRIGTHDIFKQP